MNNWNKIKKRKTLGEFPQEASQNLQAPETAPADRRISGRTKLLGLRAKPEFHHQLKKLAAEENCLMIEILEKALAEYQQKHTKFNNTKP